MSSAVVPYYNKGEMRWLSRPYDMDKEAFWRDRPASMPKVEWAFSRANRNRLCGIARYIFDTIRRMTADKPYTFFKIGGFLVSKVGDCVRLANGKKVTDTEYVVPFEKSTWRDKLEVSHRWLHKLLRRLEAIGLIQCAHGQWENNYRIAPGVLDGSAAAPAPVAASRKQTARPARPVATSAPPKKKRRVREHELYAGLRPLLDRARATTDAFLKHCAETGITYIPDEESFPEWHDLREAMMAADAEFQREFALHYGPAVEWDPPDG